MGRLIGYALIFWLLLILAASYYWPARGAAVDACEIACGPTFTSCLIANGTSAETPDARVERECRRWTEVNCIRPCRRRK